jgi:hypothetical protein
VHSIVITLRLVGLICVLALTSCVHATHQPVADDLRAKTAKAGALEPQSARVVFFLGRIMTPGRDWAPSLGGLAASEAFINGIDVGGVHAGEALVIDLPPGQYDAGSGDGPEAQNSPSLTVTLAAGEIAYLSMDIMMQRQNVGVLAGAAVGGAIGGAIAGAISAQTAEDYHGPMLHIHGDGLALIQDKQVVVPSRALPLNAPSR